MVDVCQDLPRAGVARTLGDRLSANGHSVSVRLDPGIRIRGEDDAANEGGDDRNNWSSAVFGLLRCIPQLIKVGRSNKRRTMDPPLFAWQRARMAALVHLTGGWY